MQKITRSPVLDANAEEEAKFYLVLNLPHNGAGGPSPTRSVGSVSTQFDWHAYDDTSRLAE